MRNNRNLIQAILSKDVSLPSNYKPFPDLFLLYVSDMHEDFPEPSAETEELYQDFLGQMQRALSRPLEEHIQFLVESNIREVFDRQVNTLGQTSVGTITLRDDSGTAICYVKLKGNKVTNCSYNAIKESRPIYLEPKHALDDLSRKSSIRILEPLVNDLLANEKNQLADRTIEDQERSERVIAIINKAIRGGLVENGSSLQHCQVTN